MRVAIAERFREARSCGKRHNRALPRRRLRVRRRSVLQHHGCQRQLLVRCRLLRLAEDRTSICKIGDMSQANDRPIACHTCAEDTQPRFQDVLTSQVLCLEVHKKMFDENPPPPVSLDKNANPAGLAFRLRSCWNQNWFIVLSLPAAFRAASPLKYSLWSSPMSEPDMFWCLTQAIP